jgi:hypothetical protein
MSFERIKRWFGRAAESVEERAEGGEPDATPPPGAELGDSERETSTNARMGGAADEPWPGNT